MPQHREVVRDLEAGQGEERPKVGYGVHWMVMGVLSKNMGVSGFLEGLQGSVGGYRVSLGVLLGNTGRDIWALRE